MVLGYRVTISTFAGKAATASAKYTAYIHSDNSHPLPKLCSRPNLVNIDEDSIFAHFIITQLFRLFYTTCIPTLNLKVVHLFFWDKAL